MKTVNVAVIGCGFAGNFHSNAWTKVNFINVNLRATVDSQLERAEALKEKWDYDYATADYEEVLKDPEVDVIDITLPPFLHLPFAYRAMAAGKHVICDKPLTGYFGEEGDQTPVGDKVPKAKMYESILKELQEAKDKIGSSDKLFMYAENYIYSPAIVKAAEILRKKKSRVIYMNAECSVHGSTSPLSKDWNMVGGGSIMRLGSHPIAGVLYLKQVEAEVRGYEIKPVSVVADTGRIVANFPEEEKKHILSKFNDVEDFGHVTITFSDGTKAVVLSSEHYMGGIQNHINVITNDGVLECLMTPPNNMKSFFMDDENLEDVYISENLQCKTGWNSVFVAEETLRGYTAELQAFAEDIVEDRIPESGIDIAIETTKIMYAAYLSADEGRRVDL
ncbi:putative dehydrogenase [Aequitasia blattaphilus]|uniref:Gfo/Idh/MocA family oxidoreductase n=1 Tax=Aequitasia blattaphilus TaxID=2949332 RepID=A0ABT1ECZ1_9FIRM|nr:Gfo/Idh/MocA family oxidoreductase [Aequitasia blattaphilus]MCP1103541.1 Gfo/Idh/MocA family oxidoreductase [Aequitasia blattaphilus]MCR8616181.1 Gfo/Idh/MocA family oxidoreductase [Aequitasia blattaphilus]